MKVVSGADAAVFSFSQSIAQTKDGYGKNFGQSFAGVMSDSQSQMEAPKETSKAVSRETAKQTSEKFGSSKVDKISKETRTVENVTEDQNTESTDQLSEQIQEKAGELVKNIAETFGVSEEELLEAMENMGISLMDLTNPVNLAKLAAQVMEEADGMTLITDEKLFSQMKELSGQVAQTIEEVADNLGMNVEDLIVKLDNAVESLLAQEQTAFPMEGEVFENVNEAPTEAPGEKMSNMNSNKEMVTLEKVQVNEQSAGTKLHEKQNNQSGENQQTTSSFQQAMFTEEQTVTTEAKTPIFTSDIDVESILNQIGERVKIINTEEFSSMEMQLHPESLGNLQLQVKAKEGIITAQFTTENEAVKQILEAQVVQLREKLEASGVKVEAVEVMVASHEFERNLEKGSEGEQNHYATKKVTRRKINLNVPDGEDDLDLEEDEKQARDIQVDMMKRNGNTLDYMA